MSALIEPRDAGGLDFAALAAVPSPEPLSPVVARVTCSVTWTIQCEWS
ncbi:MULTISPECIES: hypothetical protein [Actinomadura]|uniref:Uncharacterized protein n=1 Tax=Actinomadura yumaensis TaxID=111807 RepID=A0ABW2CGW7_9ACTN|nr:hypothetical protein [Actinomadura sp. J1-007]